MNTAEVINLDPDYEIDDDARPVLVGEGEYDFALVSSWKGYMFGRCPKLILNFRIVTEGPYFGKVLYRCYGIKGFRKRGEIAAKGWHSDFVREYSRLFGVPRKRGEIRLIKYQNKIFRGSVRTVDRDYKQRPLPDHIKYSVIDQLTKVVVGSLL